MQRQLGQRAWPPKELMSEVDAKSFEALLTSAPVSPPPFEALVAGLIAEGFDLGQRPLLTGRIQSAIRCCDAVGLRFQVTLEGEEGGCKGPDRRL